MPHVLILSLGPVQDFIATARRCQDLWFGSYLLSDLARAVAQAVKAEAPGALVVPGEFGEHGSVANEIIARVEDPDAVAEKAREALKGRVEHWITEYVAFPEGHRANDYFDHCRAKAQVRGLIEFLWAAVPFSDDDGYAEARRAAKELLGARKATRDWGRVDLQQVHDAPTNERYEGPYFKSTLDGTRASVIHERPRNGRVDRGGPTERQYFEWFKAKPSERLSGVDLLKRRGQEGGWNGRRFHSTSHIASGPLRARLRGYPEAVARWHEHLRQTGVALDDFCLPGGENVDAYDGALLYEDRLPDVYKEHSNLEDAQLANAVTDSRKALRQLLRDVKTSITPTPYYVTLLADGDKMGEFITKHCTSRDAHGIFSEELEGWASRCEGVVQRHEGSLIYAGGDDVLALLPLHKALRAARKLATSFGDAMNKAAERMGVKPDVKRPTISVGLAITHHLQPMRDALELARRAEAKAKDAGRDALAIVYQKRSGGALEVAAKWDQKLDERITEWCKLFRGDSMPDKVAFAFEEAVAPFDPDDKPPPVALIEALLRRTLERRRAGHGQVALADVAPQPSSDSNANAFQKIKSALRLGEIDGEIDTPEARKGLLNRVKALSHELQIARLFEDAFSDAGLDAREETKPQ